MKRGNEPIAQSGGWRIERVTQWPVAASYHHCGWCVTTNKATFDSHTKDSDLYVVFKPRNRESRPSHMIHIRERDFTVWRTGNDSVEIDTLIDGSSGSICEWLACLRDERDGLRLKLGSTSFAPHVLAAFEAMREAFARAGTGQISRMHPPRFQGYSPSSSQDFRRVNLDIGIDGVAEIDSIEYPRNHLAFTLDGDYEFTPAARRFFDLPETVRVENGQLKINKPKPDTRKESLVLGCILVSIFALMIISAVT